MLLSAHRQAVPSTVIFHGTQMKLNVLRELFIVLKYVNQTLRVKFEEIETS